MSRLRRPAAIAGVLVVLAIAFVRSFTALSDLAARNEVPSNQAWMIPVLLDATTLVATLAVVEFRARGEHSLFARIFSRSIVAAASSLSCAGNVAEVWHSGPIAIVIAALPPVFLLAMTELAVLLMRTPVDDVGEAQPSKPIPLWPTGVVVSHGVDLAGKWRAARQAEQQNAA